MAGATVYGLLAVACVIWFLFVLTNPRSKGAESLGAFIGLCPLAGCLGWTAFKFLNRRANKHDMITKPLGTLILSIGVLVIVAIVDSNSEQNRADEAARKATAQQQSEFEANQKIRDKAEHMRGLGMTGSDEDLARTYDRAKGMDDGREARERRLRN